MKEGMDKTIATLKANLAQIRAGRAASSMVENLPIDAYGSKMPLNQLATISTPDSSTILIQPWDIGNLSGVNKSLLASNLNLTPIMESNQIRITIPSLTSERRDQLVKIIKNYGEEARISIRVHRKELMDDIDAKLRDKEITEVEENIEKKKVEDLSKDFNTQIDQLIQAKTNEILTL